MGRLDECELESHPHSLDGSLTRSVTLLQSIISLDDNNQKSLIWHTREYRDFLCALEQLELAYHRISSGNHSDDESSLSRHPVVDASNIIVGSQYIEIAPSLSFLQYIATDDMILRIFSYLEYFSLLNAMGTCTRFRALANDYAIQQTRPTFVRRQLSNPMVMLKAYEQIMIGEYAVPSVNSSEESQRKSSSMVVPVPTLLLPKRILVRDCSDSEYNGIYYCTGCNGNGYVFTKPRYPIQKRLVVDNVDSSSRTNDFDVAECKGAEIGQPLRCIIARRFSEATLLWYMSKEVLTSTSGDDINTSNATDTIFEHCSAPRIKQTFSFWANLMEAGDVDHSDLLSYPSFAVRGWQSLSAAPTIAPPIVELMD